MFSITLRYPQRHGKSNLDDLIAYLTQQADENIEDSKHDLHLANEKVVSVEKRLVADYQKEIEEKIRLKKEELTAHKSVLPAKIPKPMSEDAKTDETAEIEQLTREIAEHDGTIVQLGDEQSEVSRFAEELRQVQQAIEREAGNLSGLKSQYDAILKSVGLSFDEIVKLEVDYSRLDALIAEKDERFRAIDDLLATEPDITERFVDEEGADAAIEAAILRSIICNKARLEERKTQLVERQTKPAREYQAYLTELTTWTDREREIVGDEQNPVADSLHGLEKERENIKAVYSADLRNARMKQERISKDVYRKKKDLTRFYDAIKQSIDAEIAKCRDDLGDYSISIETGLRFDRAFFDTFLGFINQGKKGSFHGAEEGRAMLRQFCDAVDDWENEAEVFAMLNTIVDALHFDRRSDLPGSEDNARDPFKQMRNQAEPVAELYDYLFGFDYLKPKYDLKVDQKDLSELSPGERGGLLLIFYLIAGPARSSPSYRPARGQSGQQKRV